MSSSAEQRFQEIAELVRDRAGVTLPVDDGKAMKKFGAGALKVNGKIFAMLVDERLVVKLPKDRVDALIDAGEGERFDPGHGRIMKEWLHLHPGAASDWVVLATDALDFVRALK